MLLVDKECIQKDSMELLVKTNNHFDKTLDFLDNVKKVPFSKSLEDVAKNTIRKLKLASPTSEIANGWNYEIIKDKNTTTLYFNNNVVTKNGENLAIIIDSGHATIDGKWVSGSNFTKEPFDEAYEEILRSTKEEIESL